MDEILAELKEIKLLLLAQACRTDLDYLENAVRSEYPEDAEILKRLGKLAQYNSQLQLEIRKLNQDTVPLIALR